MGITLPWTILDTSPWKVWPWVAVCGLMWASRVMEQLENLPEGAQHVFQRSDEEMTQFLSMDIGNKLKTTLQDSTEGDRAQP